MKALKRQRALLPCVVLLGFVNAGAVHAEATSFKVPLTGAQSVPAVDTTGSGTANLTYDPATRVVTGTSLTLGCRARLRWLISTARRRKVKMLR